MDSLIKIALLENSINNVFYKIARFYSVDKIIPYLSKVGFRNLTFAQTIFHTLEEIKEVEAVKEGYGEGSFVVVSGMKPTQDYDILN